MDESHIIKRIQRRDPDAFEELIKLHKPRLNSLARKMLRTQRDVSDAVEDALSETYANAWENLHTFDPMKGSFLVWLKTIAENICTDILRDRGACPNWQDKEGYDPRHPWDRGEVQYGNPDDDGSDDSYWLPSLDDYVEMLQAIEIERFHVWTREERRRGWIKIKIDRQPGYKIIYNSGMPWRPRGSDLPLSKRDLALLKELAKRTPREEIAKKFKMTRNNVDVAIHRINKRIADKV